MRQTPAGSPTRHFVHRVVEQITSVLPDEVVVVLLPARLQPGAVDRASFLVSLAWSTDSLIVSQVQVSSG